MKEGAKKRILKALEPLTPDQRVRVAKDVKASLARKREQNKALSDSEAWEFSEYEVNRLIDEILTARVVNPEAAKR